MIIATNYNLSGRHLATLTNDSGVWNRQHFAASVQNGGLFTFFLQKHTEFNIIETLGLKKDGTRPIKTHRVCFRLRFCVFLMIVKPKFRSARRLTETEQKPGKEESIIMRTSSAIRRQAEAVLAQRRQNAVVTAKRHLQEASEAAPELLICKEQLAGTNAELVKLILTKPADIETAIQKIRDNNLYAQNRIKELLAQHGYPEDYLKTKYVCPNCEDTGFVEGKRCDCYYQLIKKLNAEKLNAMSSMPLSDFTDFKLDYYPDETENGVNIRHQMEKVYLFCSRYANNFSLNSQSLLLLGNTGLGKTHLSLAIGQTVLGKGYDVIYGSVQDLFRQAEREHFGKAGTEEETLSNLLECDLLILDDLGAEFESSYYTSFLYHIVNSRINTGRPTIISTNLKEDQIQSRYSERIVSRLFAEYQLLRFFGKDIRQLKATERHQ